MTITAKTIVDGHMQSVNVHPRHVIFYFRDSGSGLVRLRLIDGSDAVTDLRVARVAELVDGRETA